MSAKKSDPNEGKTRKQIMYDAKLSDKKPFILEIHLKKEIVVTSVMTTQMDPIQIFRPISLMTRIMSVLVAQKKFEAIPEN